MNNPLKVLLFLAGITVVAGAGAYVSGALDPMLGQPVATVANLPVETADPASTGEAAAPKEDRIDADAAMKPVDPPAMMAVKPGDATDQPAVNPEQPVAAETTAPPAAAGATDMAAVDPNAVTPKAANEAAPLPESPAPVQAQPTPAGPILPTFDLVRVEGDGSMVVAGKAAPNAAIELLIGEKVIGAASAGASGDFVVVLDTMLAPGDYQVTIRATHPDKSVASSVQTAVVAIPEEDSGQVLAMIEEPGKPSEIITVPQPVVAAVAPEATQPKPEGKPAVAADPAQPVQGDASVEAPSLADAATPTQPAEVGAEIAATEPQPTTAAATEKPAEVAVEAVEIEGRKIFVAGRAPIGSTVRVYADELLLGESRASAAGRFLVEAEKDLAVGNHMVRADIIGANGGQVIARAAVPFVREPGENVAAVATPPSTAVQSEAVTEAPPTTPAETAVAAGQQPATPAVVDQSVDTAAANPPTAQAPAVAPPVTAAPATGDETAPQQATETPIVTEPSVPPSMTEPPAVAAATPAPIVDQPAAVAASTTPADATAPALKNVDSAVIIRRGDSLWRISKRVYGRGVRYSTIYLANQDQIQDPDRIWPGQVFGVPDRTAEGEAADLTRIGNQATTKTR